MWQLNHIKRRKGRKSKRLHRAFEEKKFHNEIRTIFDSVHMHYFIDLYQFYVQFRLRILWANFRMRNSVTIISRQNFFKMKNSERHLKARWMSRSFQGSYKIIARKIIRENKQAWTGSSPWGLRVNLAISLLDRSIQDLSDHGASKELKNPLWKWTLRFLWRLIIRKSWIDLFNKEMQNPFRIRLI